MHDDCLLTTNNLLSGNAPRPDNVGEFPGDESFHQSNILLSLHDFVGTSSRGHSSFRGPPARPMSELPSRGAPNWSSPPAASYDRRDDRPPRDSGTRRPAPPRDFGPPAKRPRDGPMSRGSPPPRGPPPSRGSPYGGGPPSRGRPGGFKPRGGGPPPHRR